MPIRCRECENSGLPHNEHCTPAELKALRQLRNMEHQARAMRRQLIANFLGIHLLAEAQASANLDGETFSVDDAIALAERIEQIRAGEPEAAPDGEDAA